jgi:dienelactone hydrolase
MSSPKFLQTICIAASCLILPIAPQAATASSDGVTVQFDSAVTPPSPLRQRLAKKQGKVAKPFTPERLTGYLFEADKDAPGVILVPGCLGLQAFHKARARQLKDQGYTALVLDSLGSRGLKRNCGGENQEGFQQAAGERVFDIYGAHTYLTQQKNIDPARIAVVGWGYSGVLGTVLEGGAQNMFDARFAGVVAYYPPCWTAFTGRFVAPVLTLVGDQDDWTPAKACRKMKTSGASGPSAIELVVLPGADHGFDNPAIKEKIYEPDVWNPSKEPTKGATLVYNANASSNGNEHASQFLKRILMGKLK